MNKRGTIYWVNHKVHDTSSSSMELTEFDINKLQWKHKTYDHLLTMKNESFKGAKHEQQKYPLIKIYI